LITVVLMSQNSRFAAADKRLDDLQRNIDQRFTAIDKRFDDLKELWRAELHRVEEILDARLRHLEEE
jgi:flagellar capping protein FliD